TQLVWNLQWPTGTSAAAPVPPQVIAECALGKLGDPVAVEGKVLRIFSQQSAVVIQTANRLLIYVTFVGGLPPAARSDNQVRLEGTISGINSRVSLYVAGKKLTAS
ncbi:MAG: hypothetical protein HY815_13825, partial [Candidatus Riflebacteria bacterium]|nr:hypothetical protein [Candidatus Riflebacteria bacterium]